jgi:hypothetical protein
MCKDLLTGRAASLSNRGGLGCLTRLGIAAVAMLLGKYELTDVCNVDPKIAGRGMSPTQRNAQGQQLPTDRY